MQKTNLERKKIFDKIVIINKYRFFLGEINGCPITGID